MRASRRGGPERLGLRDQGRGAGRPSAPQRPVAERPRGRGQGATAAAGRGPRRGPGRHRRRAGREEGTEEPRGWRNGGTLLNGRRPARLGGQVWAALSQGPAWRGGARRGLPTPTPPCPLLRRGGGAEHRAGVRGRWAGDGGLGRSVPPYSHSSSSSPAAPPRSADSRSTSPVDMAASRGTRGPRPGGAGAFRRWAAPPRRPGPPPAPQAATGRRPGGCERPPGPTAPLAEEPPPPARRFPSPAE